MPSYNKVILMGNLVEDPELKQTNSGVSVCQFRIAVQRRQFRSADGAQNTQPTADFFTIVAWRQQADFVVKYFRKGRPILVTGRLQTRTWTDTQGNKRYNTDIVADELDFTESRSSNDSSYSAPTPSDNNPSYTPDAYGTPAVQTGTDSSFQEVAGDDSLPF